MERQLDAPARRAAARRRSRSAGMRVPHARRRPQAIVGDERVTAVRFEDGSELAADLVVMAAGVRPNIELAQAGGPALRARHPRRRHAADLRPAHLRGGRVRAASPADLRPGRAAVGAGARLRAHLAEIGVSPLLAARVTATQLKVTGIDVYSAGDFAEQRGPRVAGAARSAPRHLQAPGARGQPRLRRRAVRRRARRRLVLLELIARRHRHRARCATSCCSAELRRPLSRSRLSCRLRPTRTTCPYCGVGCGVLAQRARRRQRRGARRSGASGEPRPPVRRRARRSARRVGLEDRLLHPQVRRRSACSWDEALDTVAQRLRAHHRASTARTRWRSTSPASC